MHLIEFVGDVGSGKSTQARWLAESLGPNWRHISSGQLLRERANAEEAKILELGTMTPDEVILPLMFTYLENARAKGQNLILDGFPRNLTQYQAFQAAGWQLNAVIELLVDATESKRRQLTRGRPGDTEENWQIRHDFYMTETQNMLRAMVASGVVHIKVDGNSGPEATRAAVLRAWQESLK
ncbi:nucleoside monophosphate kinase [Candidatus Saccharibacteria bacterium]|nr:nucleoside monophosphate kinase [Candidatus Saccharibacteria bacterium]